MKDFDESTLQLTISRDYAMATVSKKLHELKDNQEANALLVQCIKRSILASDTKQAYINFMEDRSTLDHLVSSIIAIISISNYCICRYFFECDFLCYNMEKHAYELHNV
jgi:hypothetical protein